MRFDAILPGFVILFVLSQVAQSHGEDAGAISKMQSRQLPPAEVTRRTFEQLSKILTLMPQRPTVPRPQRPLDELGFWTKARETNVMGLCAADEVTVSFRPVRGAAMDADTPAVVDGVGAVTHYRFVMLPKARDPEFRPWPDAGPDNPACTGLDPERTAMFTANDEVMATEGVWLFGEIARRAGTKDFAPLLQCEDIKPAAADACAAGLGALGQDDIMAIERCDVDDETVGTSCTRFWLNGFERIRVYQRDDGARKRIDRVVVTEMVGVADERAD
jgi:hypothetical protein